jgi:hypothetical protein
MTAQHLRMAMFSRDVSALFCHLLLLKWMLSVYRWKYEFVKEIFALTAEVTLMAKGPQYQAILELDRKVWAKLLPVHLNNFFEAEQCSPSVYMRKCLLWHYRAASMS